MDRENKRLICLDLIRIFSCLCVTVVHFNASISGWANGAFVYPNSIVPNYYFGGKAYLGGIGVSLFFILSGAAQMLTYREENLPAFFRKRLSSLFPMFWIAYACATIYDLLYYKGMGGGSLLQLANSFVGMDGYLASLGLGGYDFYKVGEWFLGCILLLYVIFPLLHVGLKKLPVVTLGLSVAVYVFFECHPFIGRYQIQGIEFFLRIPEFLFGMLFVKYRLWEGKKLLVATLATLCAFAIVLVFKERLSSLTVTVAFCMFMFCALSLCARGLRGERLAGRLAAVSGLTYPIFLVHHFLINKMVAGFALESMSRLTVAGMFAAYLIITAVLAVGLKRVTGRVMKFAFWNGPLAKALWALVLVGIVAAPVAAVTCYAMDTPPAAVLTEAAGVCDAEIQEHNTPLTVERGKSYDIDIVARNTGAEAWSEAKQIRLCIWQDGADWGYRLLIPDGVEVAPGESFTFRLIGFGAPPTESTYLEYQMVQEGVQYFGEKARADIAIVDGVEGDEPTDVSEPQADAVESAAGEELQPEPVEPAAVPEPQAESALEGGASDSGDAVVAEPDTLEGYDARIVSQSTPQQVNRYGLYDIDIVVANTGTKPWSEAQAIRLCIFQDGQDYGYRIGLPEGEKVAPGGQFSFHLAGFGAPQVNGGTYLEYQMVKGDTDFFGDKVRADIEIAD